LVDATDGLAVAEVDAVELLTGVLSVGPGIGVLAVRSWLLGADELVGDTFDDVQPAKAIAAAASTAAAPAA
jgi:hypothetical protein